MMLPNIGGAGSGFSLTDNAPLSASFDPFSDLKRSFNQSLNIKSSGTTLESLLPIIILAVVGIIVYKLFFK